MGVKHEFDVDQLKLIVMNRELDMEVEDIPKYDAYFYLNEKGDPIFVVEQVN